MNFLNEFVWNDEFWLPNNTTWVELRKYNNFSHYNLIFIPCCISILLYLMRLSFER